eukprot:scaffold585_cov237-Pinguiococcus_pyrenoidosus.AAC.14
MGRHGIRSEGKVYIDDNGRFSGTTSPAFFAFPRNQPRRLGLCGARRGLLEAHVAGIAKGVVQIALPRLPLRSAPGISPKGGRVCAPLVCQPSGIRGSAPKFQPVKMLPRASRTFLHLRSEMRRVQRLPKASQAKLLQKVRPTPRKSTGPFTLTSHLPPLFGFGVFGPAKLGCFRLAVPSLSWETERRLDPERPWVLPGLLTLWWLSLRASTILFRALGFLRRRSSSRSRSSLLGGKRGGDASRKSKCSQSHGVNAVLLPWTSVGRVWRAEAAHALRRADASCCLQERLAAEVADGLLLRESPAALGGPRKLQPLGPAGGASLPQGAQPALSRGGRAALRVRAVRRQRAHREGVHQGARGDRQARLDTHRKPHGAGGRAPSGPCWRGGLVCVCAGRSQLQRRPGECLGCPRGGDGVHGVQRAEATDSRPCLGSCGKLTPPARVVRAVRLPSFLALSFHCKLCSTASSASQTDASLAVLVKGCADGVGRRGRSVADAGQGGGRPGVPAGGADGRRGMEDAAVADAAHACGGFRDRFGIWRAHGRSQHRLAPGLELADSHGGEQRQALQRRRRHGRGQGGAGGGRDVPSVAGALHAPRGQAAEGPPPDGPARHREDPACARDRRRGRRALLLRLRVRV